VEGVWVSVGREEGGSRCSQLGRALTFCLSLPSSLLPSCFLPLSLALCSQAMGEKRFLASKYELAAKLFASTILGGGYSDFLTTLCYEHILSTTGKARM
jgi:hypothetical protein